MTLALVFGIGVAGGLGAVARYAQDTLVTARYGRGVGWGTLSVNVAGSLLLGMITGAALFGGESGGWRLVLGVGFCGGYTTFSTAMVDVVTLARDRRWGAAAVNLLGTLVATVAAAALGFWVVS
ncbi:CrcB family protein [Gordonia caeni]|uniref:Fluoride-specific ion channel FluC n=1 Tax=Gordonia caeni TaxID=1007097 RepID=A0ABP7PJB0_9ACTN